MIEYIKVAIFFVVGIYLYGRVDVSVALIFMLSLILVLPICAIFKHKFNKNILIMMSAMFIGLGLSTVAMSDSTSELYEYDGRYVNAIGRICEVPNDTGTKNGRYVLDIRLINGEEIKEKILLTTEKKLKYNDTVEISGFVDGIGERLNSTDFDYGKYYKRRGISYKIYSEKVRKADIEIKDYSPYALNNSFKNFVSETIDKYYTGDGGAILKSVLTGNSKGFSEEFDNVLTKTGTKRCFYSSYLHIMLAMAIISGLLSVFGKRTRDILTIVFLGIYAFANASNSTAVRLAVMFAVIIFTEEKFGRRYYPDIVGITVIVAGLASPLILFDQGFVMSVLSSCLIYYFFDYVYDKLDFVKVKYVRRMLAIGIICTIGLLPVSAYFFRTVSVYSILLSVILLPCTVMVMILSPLTFAMLCIFGNAPIIKSALLCVLYIMKLVPTVAYKIGFTNITMARPSLLLLIIYVLLLASGVKFIKKKHTHKRIALFVACALSVSYIGGEIMRMNDVKITYINVGQGDGALITAPHRFNILIDGGGGTDYSDYNPGEKLFLEYLENSGIRKIDSAFVSHYHQDHVQGIIAAVEKLDVRNLFLPSSMEDNEWRTMLEEAAEKNGTRIYYIDKDTILTYNNGMTISIAPPVSATEVSNDENDTSLLHYVEYGGFTAAFTGDMTKFAEENILRAGKAKKVNLLKVSHHGSRTASGEKWLEALDPEYAVISVGEKNVYGLPNDDVVERLVGAEVFRTDYNGDIKFTIHKNGTVRTDVCDRR